MKPLYPGPGTKGLLITLAVLLGAAQTAPAQAAPFHLDETRQVLKEWLTTQRALTSERHDWELEKASLESTVRLLENEMADLDAAIAQARATATQADERRRQLREQHEALRTSGSELEQIVAGQEDRVRALLKILPDPVLKEIGPLVQRLPKAGTETSQSLSQRIQNVVGILTQAEKFNNSVTVVAAVRDLPDGASAEVRTIYFGLGAAYFVDASGTYAGIGQPGPQGWTWTEQAEIGPAVAHAIAVYENTEPPAFVGLPIVIR